MRCIRHTQLRTAAISIFLSHVAEGWMRRAANPEAPVRVRTWLPTFDSSVQPGVDARLSSGRSPVQIRHGSPLYLRYRSRQALATCARVSCVTARDAMQVFEASTRVCSQLLRGLVLSDDNADVVQRQNFGAPLRRRGFESRLPHQKRRRSSIGRAALL